MGKIKYEQNNLGKVEKFIDITEFADWNAATGQISLRVPIVSFDSNLISDNAMAELKSKFGGKTTDEMIDAAYDAIQKVSTAKWVSEVLLKA